MTGTLSTTTPPVILSEDWAPTLAGCLRTTDFWRWFWDNADGRTVVGGPSQVTQCFPSTWNAVAPYEGSNCPSQYTSACDNGTATTCCPNLYSLSCVESSIVNSAANHAASFRCVSQYGTGGSSMTVTTTNMEVNTQGAVATVTATPGQHLYALGMVYTTQVRGAS